MTAAVLLIFVLLIFAASAFAQDRTQLLDVVVTDAAGHPVPGLSAADFEISLDGRPQHILGCSYETAQQPASPTTPMLLGPAHQAAARRMVLVIDDLNLSSQGAGQIRQTLRHYTDEQMHPGDELVIMRTSSGTGGRQQFTSDPKVLRAAIDRIRPRSLPGPGPDSLFAAGALGILELAFDGLRGLPGRKSVVLITEAKPSGSAGLDELAERANRSFAVFYAISATGIETPFLTPPTNPSRPSISPLMAATPDEPLGSILEALAKATGGLVLDRRGVAAEFARVLEDRQNYYLLRYSRDFAIFRPATGEQLVESVAVKTTRDGLTIRTRNGFPQSFGALSYPPATSQERLVEALRSPFSTADLRFGLSALFSHTAKDGPVLKLLFHVDGRDITFRKALNGQYHYGLEAAIMTLGESEKPTVHAHVHLGDMPMSEAQHQEALEHGTFFEIRLLTLHPGPCQLRIALSDQMSDRVGSAYQFVNLPDVASGQLTLSSITLPRSVPGDPTTIHLNPGEPLLVAYEIYNLARGPDNRSEIELQSHLMLGPSEVTAASESLIQFGPSDDPTHRTVASRLKLGSSLRPGAYTLKLTFIDKLAKPGRATTGEISFKVPAAQ